MVSVIIPNYNHARFLDERIQSVLNQTYKNLEVIILDDNSSDNSIEIIDKYRDNPFVSHIIINKENSGSTFKQWQKGFELAKGDIIWIAESDDSCDNTLLEKLISVYTTNHAVLAFCKSSKYDEAGILYEYDFQNSLRDDFCIGGKVLIKNVLCRLNIIANASSAVFSKQAALQINPQYAEMKGLGDWLFWIELAECGTVCYLSEPLNYFRFHSTNTTNRLLMQGISLIERKKLYNYLVIQKYLQGRSKIHNRMEVVDFIVKYNKFERGDIKKNSLQLWDRYYFYRTLIILLRWKNRISCVINKIK